MISTLIKTAVRNLLKNKTVSFINIAGLAIGLASCITILAYIGYELSYDRFHQNAGRIYRGVIRVTSENEWETSPQMVAAVGPALVEDFPEIEKTVRFRAPEDRYLGYNDRSTFVRNVLYSDSTLFDVFSFRLLRGNPGQALAAPFSIVLSEQTAGKIFGTADALGKTVILDNKDLLTVTGIVPDTNRDPPGRDPLCRSFCGLLPGPAPFVPERCQTHQAGRYSHRTKNRCKKHHCGVAIHRIDRHDHLLYIFIQATRLHPEQ